MNNSSRGDLYAVSDAVHFPDMWSRCSEIYDLGERMLWKKRGKSFLTYTSGSAWINQWVLGSLLQCGLSFVDGLWGAVQGLPLCYIIIVNLKFFGNGDRWAAQQNGDGMCMCEWNCLSSDKDFTPSGYRTQTTAPLILELTLPAAVWLSILSPVTPAPKLSLPLQILEQQGPSR